MNAANVIPILFAVLIALMTVLDTCSTEDEDAAISTAPPEYVEAFQVLDSLERAHPNGALLLILTQRAYERGYADALDVCAVACATFTDSLCSAQAPSSARTNLQPTTSH